MTKLQDSAIAPSGVIDPLPGNSEDLITQAELERFQELRNLAREYDELRHRIREKVEQGVQIEHGKFSLCVERRSQKNFTLAKIAAILGEEKALWLREKISPSRYVTLRVVETRQD